MKRMNRNGFLAASAMAVLVAAVHGQGRRVVAAALRRQVGGAVAWDSCRR
jgi:hypothetical protein